MNEYIIIIIIIFFSFSLSLFLILCASIRILYTTGLIPPFSFSFFFSCMSSQKSHLRIYTLLRMCFRVSVPICPGPSMISSIINFFFPSFLLSYVTLLSPPSLPPTFPFLLPSIVHRLSLSHLFIFLLSSFPPPPNFSIPPPIHNKKIKTSSLRQVGERLLQRNRVRRGYRIR